MYPSKERNSNSSSEVRLHSFALNGSIADEISLELGFGSKWIVLSEVHFDTEPAREPHFKVLQSDKGDYKEEYNDDKSAGTKDSISKKNAGIQNTTLNSLTIDSSSDEHLEKKTLSPIPVKDLTEMYVGISIGILGMVVVLLIIIIYYVLRGKNYQIFAKNSSKDDAGSFFNDNRNLCSFRFLFHEKGGRKRPWW